MGNSRTGSAKAPMMRFWPGTPNQTPGNRRMPVKRGGGSSSSTTDRIMGSASSANRRSRLEALGPTDLPGLTGDRRRPWIAGIGSRGPTRPYTPLASSAEKGRRGPARPGRTARHGARSGKRPAHVCAERFACLPLGALDACRSVPSPSMPCGRPLRARALAVFFFQLPPRRPLNF